MNNDFIFILSKNYVVMKCLNDTYENDSFNLFIY